MKGFTLFQVILVLAVALFLIALFYVGTRDYTVAGRDVLMRQNSPLIMSAGETYYKYNHSSYQGFCDYNYANKLMGQIQTYNHKLYCQDSIFSWSICVQEFNDTSKAYCFDSNGAMKDIDNSICNENLVECP
jgi:hypothetical protein